MLKMDSRVRAAIEATDKPWEVVPGKKHFQIRLDGRLVGILAKNGTADERTVKNTVSQIRKAAICNREQNQ